MVPRTAPKGILEEGWETCERQRFNVEAFWPHLGDFGRFLGAREIQGGAKNGPKHRLRHLFGTQRRLEGVKRLF